MTRSNPNNANQYIMDPRQKLCWESYIDPRSDTFGNALQSAIKAGYSVLYAGGITGEKWFSEKLRRLNLLGKAEKVLDNTLGYDPVDPATGKVDHLLARVVLDAGKFVSERLGKDEGYAQRTESTGKNGKPLFTVDTTPEDEELLDIIVQHERDADTKVEQADGTATEPVGEEIQDQE